MLLTLRTLDHQTIKMEVYKEETVSEFKDRIEDEMGRENLYKVIYYGKILEDDRLLSDYNIDPSKSLVLMITKPRLTNSTVIKPAITKHDSIEELDNVKISKTVHFEDEEEEKEEEEEEDEEGHSEYDNGSVYTHYVTDREFTFALEVITTTDYLEKSHNEEVMNKDDIMQAVNDYAFGRRAEDVRHLLSAKISEIYEAHLNRSQMEAFMDDIEDIYIQDRVPRVSYEVTFDNEDVEEDILLSDFEEKARNIERMGFDREQVEMALRVSFNNCDQAVEYLLSGIPPLVLPPEENPLAFLRTNEEFKQVKVLVNANPDMLSSLLLSFGNKNPELLDLINQNKLTFLRMINEPAGCKGLEDDSGVVVDAGIDLHNEDLGDNVDEHNAEAIVRLKELGFPEDQVIEAYVASHKNENLAVDYLLSNSKSRS